MEHGAAVVVEEGFRRCALGDDHVVGFEFDVEIFDLLDAVGLHDGHTVDEVLRLDQHAVEIHGVLRRYPQVAARRVLVKRAGLDADRQDFLLAQ